MIIQINTDNNLSIDERSNDFFSAQISEELQHFSSHITRIELHLKDESAGKDGLNYISCVLEARLENRQPIAVTSQEDSIDLAVSSAIEKAKTAINSIMGKIQSH
jgi:hypothetical protein